jgi:glycosyltransferase involved in cell wall biosynthesis
MRVLGVINRFPPAGGGGYGEICADMMRELAARGHDVTLLVGGDRASAGMSPNAGGGERLAVRRELDYVLAPWRHPISAARAVFNDEDVVSRALTERPDVAIVWHARGLVKPPLRMLHEAGVPVVYMLHDRWVLYERAGSIHVPWSRLDAAGAHAFRERLGALLAPRLELRAPPIAEEGIVCFVSRWLQEEHERRGWRPRRAQLVPCGVDVERFRDARERPVRNPPLKMMFAGRMDARKGLQVAINALARTSHPYTLTIAAIPDDARYERRMRALAGQLGVSDRISWLGDVPRSEMPGLLGRHDVLAYPSTDVEAYSLGLLEALASGIVVVTSAVGGPREYLRDGENAVVTTPGDPDELADALRRLAEDPLLTERIVAGAAQTAESLSLSTVVDQFESLLAEIGGVAMAEKASCPRNG